MTTVNETIRQLFGELRIMEDTIRLLRTRLSLIQTNILDLRRAGSTLEALKKMEVGHSALIPIGANSYAQARISDVGRAIINMGAGIYMEKDIEEAAKYIGDRLSELEKAEIATRQQLLTVTQRYDEGSKRLYELLQRREKTAREA